jgi:hypothetical protein
MQLLPFEEKLPLYATQSHNLALPAQTWSGGDLEDLSRQFNTCFHTSGLQPSKVEWEWRFNIAGS